MFIFFIGLRSRGESRYLYSMAACIVTHCPSEVKLGDYCVIIFILCFCDFVESLYYF